MKNKKHLRTLYIFKTVFWILITASIIVMLVLTEKHDDIRYTLIFGGFDILLFVVKLMVDSYFEIRMKQSENSEREKSIHMLERYRSKDE